MGVKVRKRKIKQTIIKDNESHLCPYNPRDRWDIRYVVMDVAWRDIDEQWWELVDITVHEEEQENTAIYIHYCPFCGWKLPLNQHYYYPDDEKDQEDKSDEM